MKVRTVRLFTTGRSLAVRIPRDLELPSDMAVIRKDGDRLILQPAPPQSLLVLLRTLGPIAETFSDIDDPAPEPVTL